MLLVRTVIAFLAFGALQACRGQAAAPQSASGTATVPAPLPPIDYSVWRDVDAKNNKHSILAMLCASQMDKLEAADPSLKDNVALQIPWQVQVTRRGKLQAQCEWSGPAERVGRMVVDVHCMNDENDRCASFAYGVEGGRTIKAVKIIHHPPPPISAAYPPGTDEEERSKSLAILGWARDHAADDVGALRVQFRETRVGIVADAKVPFVCGQVSADGTLWHRFAVYSLAGSSYQFLREPKDRSGVRDFRDARQEDLQWYSVPDRRMAEG